MLPALTVEGAKLKREPLVLWTAGTALIAPVLSNIFATAQEPGFSGMSWTDFFGLGRMTLGTWYGILLFGLVAAFLFGHEYTQGVAPSMLTTPVRREQFVIAKLIVLAAWVFALTVLALLSHAVVATALGLDGFVWSEVWPIVEDVFVVALLIFLTLPLVGLVALVSRGVFAPMIFSAAGFLAGMVGGIAGWGEWLPWAMPTTVAGTFLGPILSRDLSLTAMSWVIVIAIFFVGVGGMLWWVNNADAQA